MKRYIVKIVSEALLDIQDITDWYNLQKRGLGKRFQKIVIRHIDSLSKRPHAYAVRYNNIRCALIKGFPYMIHYNIDEDEFVVKVLAVISTDRNPKIWEEKTNDNC